MTLQQWLTSLVILDIDFAGRSTQKMATDYGLQGCLTTTLQILGVKVSPDFAIFSTRKKKSNENTHEKTVG